ncbi:hypothetical protein C1N53_18755 [Pontibacter sp. SGAir0037]|nr:hypothetical protein C1N53_18755 [Pontibacter sp. SGAir0037]
MLFYRNLVIFSGIIGLVIWMLMYFTGHMLVHQYIWYIGAFFVFVTGFAYYITDLGVKNDPENFQVYYFSAVGFRFVLSLAVVLGYAYFVKAGILIFVLNFFMLYFLFTGFEIYSLLANLRPNLKRHTK